MADALHVSTRTVQTLVKSGKLPAVPFGQTVRIDPADLRRFIDDAKREGEAPLVAIGGKGAVIRRVRAIWKQAGVEPWQRLWQTLRSSCEKEWAMTHPQFAVSKWIGHSITVSGKHYANAVPDELFERAAGGSAVATVVRASNVMERRSA